MKIQIRTAVVIGDDKTSKLLKELITKGEKLFWVKNISIKGVINEAKPNKST